MSCSKECLFHVRLGVVQYHIIRHSASSVRHACCPCLRARAFHATAYINASTHNENSPPNIINGTKSTRQEALSTSCMKSGFSSFQFLLILQTLTCSTLCNNRNGFACTSYNADG